MTGSVRGAGMLFAELRMAFGTCRAEAPPRESSLEVRVRLPPWARGLTQGLAPACFLTPLPSHLLLIREIPAGGEDWEHLGNFAAACA